MSGARGVGPRWTTPISLLLGLLASGWAGPIVGQLPTDSVVVDSLPNGVGIVVAPDPTVPWVTVQIGILGGAAAESPERVGVSALVAGGLLAASVDLTERQVADTLDHLGARVSATAFEDWIGVSLSVPSELVGEALGVVAELIRNPAFPLPVVESERTRALSGLGASWSNPPIMASRVLRRTVFGAAHPYGRDDGIDGLGQALVTDLRRYHARHFVPANVTVALAGDLTPDRARGILDRSFGDWAAADDDFTVPAPAPDAATRVLVHVPGATRVVLRMGHALPRNEELDWLALEVANRIIGGAADARLASALVETELGVGAFSGLTRHVGSGFFQIGAEAAAEDAEALIEVLNGVLVEFLEEGPSTAELERVKRQMLGALPLQRESPEQRASQLAAFRLLGRPAGEWSRVRERIRALDVEAVRHAARTALDPADLRIVAVGDATLLRGRMAALGPLRIEDTEGVELRLADLTPPVSEMEWDTRGLAPGRWEYRILVEETEIGVLTRTLADTVVAGTEAFVMTSAMVTGAQRLVQSATFSASDFRPLSADFTLQAAAASAGARLEVRGDSVVGERSFASGRVERFAAPFVPGALIGEMLEAALWILPHEPGYGVLLPILQVQSGASARVGIGVAGRSRVNVPAGSYDAYVVEIAGEQGTQIAWVHPRAPHVVLRLASPGRPEVLELVRSTLERPGG